MFCPECGTQQPEWVTQPARASASAYEICDIRFELTSAGGLLGAPRGRFYARIGRKGCQQAGASGAVRAQILPDGKVWSDATDREIDRALDHLEARLRTDVCRPLGQVGLLCWERRFRRRIA